MNVCGTKTANILKNICGTITADILKCTRQFADGKRLRIVLDQGVLKNICGTIMEGRIWQHYI